MKFSTILQAIPRRQLWVRSNAIPRDQGGGDPGLQKRDNVPKARSVCSSGSLHHIQSCHRIRTSPTKCASIAGGLWNNFKTFSIDEVDID
jgi:hypothetical protein